MRKTIYKKLFQRNSILQKMLISVVGLICIPLIGMQLFQFIRSGDEFEQMNTAQHLSMLHSLGDSFGNELESLSLSALRIGLDDAVVSVAKPNASDYSIYMAALAIQEYKNTHPLIQSVGVYYRNQDMVLHNVFRKNASFFAQQYFPLDSHGYGALQDYLQNTDTLDCFATESYPADLTQTLFVARPVRISARTQEQATVFFTINKQILEDWCSVFIPSSSGFAILTTEGQVLLAGGEFGQGLLVNPEFQKFLHGDHQSSYLLKADTEQVIYKYQDIRSDYIYLTAIPRGTAQESFIHFVDEAKATMLLTVLLACVMLVFTLYINYKPIFRLMNKHTKSNPQDANLSELELIDSLFFDRDEKINDQERLLTTFTVGDILTGINVDPGQVERYFPAAVYSRFVTVISDTPMNTLQAGQVAKEFEKLAGGKLTITTVPNRPETVIIYASNQKIQPLDFRAALQKVLGEGVTFNIGTVVDDIMQIRSSYYAALFADKLADPLGENTTGAYPSDLIQAMEQYVTSGSKTGVQLILTQLEKVVPQLKPTARRFLCFKILHSYIAAVQDSPFALNAGEIDRLISFNNSTHLFSMLRRSVDSQQDPKMEDAGQAALLSYVDNNYLDSTLCLSAAADYMQTSIYTVSRIFKEATGMGFKEYITQKRLSYACHLLETSQIPVTQIASDCGFENANYFTTVFKNEYGIPPSKYRSNIGEDS